ncbi:hypothetical protein [Clostridium chromiireducens]|uniref:Uncharacterized protein n=1 Tax=Clostridium chromiireducens TaxID=225345 RepID=A0A1V4IL12_9CLOT|nr:hypothetical protein [Clostridium chromiireducens]OPJ60514.1 hypothetical protein CLCHR_28610 [Clostridium chromiireducens]
MVRNAYDVQGLKILNSNNSVQSSASSVYSGSAKKSASKKGNMTSSSDSPESLK